MTFPGTAGILPAHPTLPVVLTRDEVKALLSHLHGLEHLFFSLLYGTGLRLAEGLRLRIKDVDFTSREITVRDGKGGKDRMTVLPDALKPQLLEHLRHVRDLHERDLADGARVSLPYALARKYPRAASEWAWQYVFPAPALSRDPRTNAVARHHLHERALQRAFKIAVGRARIAKPATAHTLRQSFATHLLLAGYDIRTVQEILGHRSVKTTMIYTDVLNRGGRGIHSPLDAL